MSMSEVYTDTKPPDPTKTVKLMAMVFHVDDWRLLEEMHRAACARFPSMRVDDVCSAILTEGIRIYREKKAAGETPALPGENAQP